MTAIKLRDYQQVAFDEIRLEFRAQNYPVLFVLPTGGGKCLGAGTPILMHDGTIKPVESIQVGDAIMGPDSKPRRVMSLARGREPLYRVTPTKGDAYMVNESHILSLKRTPTKSEPKYPCQRGGEIVNVGVLDYLGKSATWRHVHKGWRAAVDFPVTCETLPIEPYFLGLWLGDGHSHIAKVTTGDEEVAQYLIDYAARLGMKIGWRDNSPLSIVVEMQGAGLTGRSGTPLMNALRSCDLIRNKHIPHRFKTASKDDRLALLAGLIDSDGSYTGKGYDVALGDERLIDDLIFVARSLGFSAYKAASRRKCHNNGVVGDYWRCAISGDVDQIPCLISRKKAAPRQQKKSVLVTGIKVEPVGVGDYFGFEIDGDHLFMLGDFTVTHNTYTFSAIAASAAEKGREVFIIVHRKELMTQASASLESLDIEHGLISPFFTPDPHKLVQVASVDTLAIRLKKRPHKKKPGGLLVIFDEAHHVVDGNKWGRVYEALGKPPMLGVTATPVRTDGKGLGDHAGGVFKTMVRGPSVQDLIERGMLVNPTVYTSRFVPDFSDLKINKDGDYNLQELAAKVDKPRITGDAVEHYTTICPGSKAIAFCASIEHAKHVREEFNAAGYKFELLVGSPEMSDAERTSVNKRLRSGDIHGVCTVDLVSEGYDLPDLQTCIMLRPTASEGLFLQQVGRVMRPKEGGGGCWLLDHVGNVGVLIDGEFKRKHGLPNEERSWTLDGRKKKKRKVDPDEPTIEMKQCPQCFVVHLPQPNCPTCGYEYPTASRKVEEVDGSLGQVTEEMQAQAHRQRMAQQASAKTVDELMQTLGYSRGRAEALVKARAEKDALRNALVADLETWRAETGIPPQEVIGMFISDIKRLKPKELAAKRTQVELAFRAYKTARENGDDPVLALRLANILNPAAWPHSAERLL